MKKISLKIIVLILVLGAAASLAWADNPPNFSIDWQVLSGGGQPVVNDSSDITLNGTLGQSITGSSASGNVVLDAGYWSKALLLRVYFMPIIGR